MREEYFKARNLKEDLRLVQNAKDLLSEQMKRLNIMEGSPRENFKSSFKRGARGSLKKDSEI